MTEISASFESSKHVRVTPPKLLICSCAAQRPSKSTADCFRFSSSGRSNFRRAAWTWAMVVPVEKRLTIIPRLAVSPLAAPMGRLKFALATFLLSSLGPIEGPHRSSWFPVSFCTVPKRSNTAMRLDNPWSEFEPFSKHHFMTLYWKKWSTHYIQDFHAFTHCQETPWHPCTTLPSRRMLASESTEALDPIAMGWCAPRRFFQVFALVRPSNPLPRACTSCLQVRREPSCPMCIRWHDLAPQRGHNADPSGSTTRCELWVWKAICGIAGDQKLGRCCHNWQLTCGRPPKNQKESTRVQIILKALKPLKSRNGLNSNQSLLQHS